MKPAGLLAALILAGTLSGCIVLRKEPRHDLSIAAGSVKLVDPATESPIITWQDKPVLRVALTTTPDLKTYGFQTTTEPVAAVSFCADGTYDFDKNLVSWSIINRYWGPASPASGQTAPASPPYFVYIALHVENHLGWFWGRMFAYDLHDTPQDICIQLKGDRDGGRFESNTVMIPPAAVTAALNAGKP